MIRVTKIGKIFIVHLRRHDTEGPVLMRIGADEVPSQRQFRMRFKQALQLETKNLKF